MEQAIGIIGGVGPYAGIDLVRKVFDHTVAARDQEHIPLYLVSVPSLIADRTDYLLRGGDDPVPGMYECFSKLVCSGATTIGVACNTAHADDILGRMRERTDKEFPSIHVLNMIDETCKYLNWMFPQGAKVGLLATCGTHDVGVYRQYMDRYPALELIEPDEQGRLRVHGAIYDKEYGVKAVYPVSSEARAILVEEASILVGQGAQAIILGCTELPLALEPVMVDCPLVDPTDCLAMALVLDVAPQKFKR